MNKTVFPRFLFFLIILFSISQAATAQNADFSPALTADLKQSFSDFDLIKIKPETAYHKAINGGKLELAAGDNTFSLQLTPRNLLSPKYRAEASGANGLKAIAAPPIHTFKGILWGDASSIVRLTISDKEIEGLIVRGNEFYYIEAAENFSEKAGNDEFVVYRQQDLLKTAALGCDLSHRLEEAAQQYLPQTETAENSVPAFRVTEIATEADFQFVTELGGAAAANAEILSVLNVVEGLYQNELGISFSVTFQHAWTVADPYSAAAPETVLQNFRSYWNANFPAASYSRDVAHLFSSKDSLRGQGRAYVGVICRPDAAYGLHGRFPYGTARFSMFAHELGHNFNAGHTDANASCGNTLMNSQITTATPLTFCSASRADVTNYVAGNNSCLPLQTFAKPKFDFDGDRRADVSVFRRNSGDWYFLQSRTDSLRGMKFGLSGDVPVAEDFDGDSIADTAVYRGGSWYLLSSRDNSFRAYNFGANADIPVPADFTGDGGAEIAVYRPAEGMWYWLDLTNNNFRASQFGTGEDVPTPEDFDGDGAADVAVFRPSTGSWYRLNSSNGQFVAVSFGTNGDRPVPADFDGDGRADVAVFRANAASAQAAWYILRSSGGGMTAASFGNGGDIPVPADYDGDGRADISVFRAGLWYRLNSSNGAFGATQFGGTDDIPIPRK